MEGSRGHALGSSCIHSGIWGSSNLLFSIQLQMVFLP